jgi:hypothetical protein
MGWGEAFRTARPGSEVYRLRTEVNLLRAEVAALRRRLQEQDAETDN